MHTLGYSFLLLVILLWVLSGFLVNSIGTWYNKPFFLTYLNTSFMVFYLPFVKSYANLKATAYVAAEFALLWFLSNLFNNASYFYTSVPSATIIACTSSFWTLVVAHIFAIDRFTTRKFCLLLCSLGGVGLITYQDENSAAPHPLAGNMLALLGAMAYGLYTCLLKVRVGDESKIDTKLFMGLVGLFSFLALWPFILLLHLCGVETFEAPPRQVWTLILVNGVTGMLSDLCWVLATLMTSPLIVAVGLSGTIPVSVLGEYVLGKSIGGWVYYVGAAVVFWSFVEIAKESESERNLREPETEAVASIQGMS